MTDTQSKSTRTLVVYAHPYTGSFNHAVLEATTTALDKANRPYDVIDLYADGFDPRYTVEELALFSDGGTLDPLVTRYQELIKGASSSSHRSGGMTCRARSRASSTRS